MVLPAGQQGLMLLLLGSRGQSVNELHAAKGAAFGQHRVLPRLPATAPTEATRLVGQQAELAFHEQRVEVTDEHANATAVDGPDVAPKPPGQQNWLLSAPFAEPLKPAPLWAERLTT